MFVSSIALTRHQLMLRQFNGAHSAADILVGVVVTLFSRNIRRSFRHVIIPHT